MFSGATTTRGGQDTPGRGDDHDAQRSRVTQVNPPRALARTRDSQFPAASACEANNGYCWAPGEPTVSAGPSYLVETVNDAVVIYDKAGNKIQSMSSNTAVGIQPSTSGYDGCVDVRGFYYGGATGHFVVSCWEVEGEDNGHNNIHFAVSHDSNPLHGWYTYEVPHGGDQPSVGVSSGSLVVNAAADGNFYVYQLGDVQTGKANPAMKMVTDANTLWKPAAPEDAAPSSYWVTSYGKGSPIRLLSISGTPSNNNVTLVDSTVGTNSFASSHAATVPQGTVSTEFNDPRVNEAVYSIDPNFGGAGLVRAEVNTTCADGHDCIGLMTLNPSPPRLVSQTYADDCSTCGDTTAASIAYDQAGNLYTGVSRTTATSMPEADVTGPGYWNIVQSAATNTDAGGGDERWGDFSTASRDPSDPTKVWVVSLWQQANGFYGWSSSINCATSTGLCPSAPATPAPPWNPSAIAVDPTSIRVSWTDNSNNETGFEVNNGQVSHFTAANTSSHLWTGLSPGTFNCFRVRSSNGSGNSAYVPVGSPFYVCATTPSSDFDVASAAGWQSTSVSVTAGSRYAISYLSGTWSVDYRNLPRVGPSGYSPSVDAGIYQGCKFVSGVTYGTLLGSIAGNSAFVVGVGGTFTAGASGLLALRINDADACLGDNAGTVRVAMTPSPAIGANIAVTSTGGWRSTTINLTKGSQFSIAYSGGSWSVDHRNVSFVGPVGYSPSVDAGIYQGCKVLTSVPYGTLLGSIGGQAAFVVGAGGQFTAAASGVLTLRINDADSCLSDNAGAITATVFGQSY